MFNLLKFRTLFDCLKQSFFNTKWWVQCVRTRSWYLVGALNQSTILYMGFTKHLVCCLFTLHCCNPDNPTVVFSILLRLFCAVIKRSFPFFLSNHLHTFISFTYRSFMVVPSSFYLYSLLSIRAIINANVIAALAFLPSGYGSSG